MKLRIAVSVSWMLVVMFLLGSIRTVLSAPADGSPPGTPTAGPAAEVASQPPALAPQAQLLPGAAPALPILSADPRTDWVNVGPGMDYREYGLPDPNRVYVARLERGNPQAIIESSIAQGKLVSGVERMTDQASRYDQALNYWGSGGDGAWGGRGQVVVAINGSYFDVHGVPQQGVVHSSWYAKRFDFCQSGNVSGSGFAWRLDRTPFIGGPVSHPADKQIVTYADNSTQEFQGINIPLGTDELLLYTPQFDARTPYTDTTVTEVVVEMAQPDQLRLIGEKVQGVIKDVRIGHGETLIPFDHLVLVAHGNKRGNVEAKAHVGEPIYISHRIKDCSGNQLDTLWNRAYASIGGAFYFLENGAIHSFPGEPRHPRTAIAYNDQYIFFIVVDGRDPDFSVGMTIDELAQFARDTLGATYGIAQDGGGSSTMVVNGVVMNNTFCNNKFCKGSLLLPMVVGGGAGASGRAKLSLNDVYKNNQRYVANGMLMVATQPITTSLTFTDGQAIMVTSAANLRLGPGTNYAVISTINANTLGGVVPHSNHLNGVLAKGYYWWKVQFGDLVGWMAENLISPVE